MNELDCASYTIEGIRAYPQCFTGAITQHGTHPFTASQYAITHGPMQFLRKDMLARKSLFQRMFRTLLTKPDIFF